MSDAERCKTSKDWYTQIAKNRKSNLRFSQILRFRNTKKLTKNGVLAIEPLARIQRDKELRLVGVWCVLIRHGHLASVIELDAAVSLIFEWSAPDRLST